MSEYTIPSLTDEQIQTLQSDEALRLIGTLTKSLTLVNQEMREAVLASGRARMRLEEKKNDKSTIIELIRALKIIVANG